VALQENTAHENGTDSAVHHAADAVFAESLQARRNRGLEMDEEAYRRKGVAALIAIKEISRAVILDSLRSGVKCEPAAGRKSRRARGGSGAVCEMANMVIGNS